MFVEFINDKAGRPVLININSIAAVDQEENPAFSLITLNDSVGTIYRVRRGYEEVKGDIINCLVHMGTCKSIEDAILTNTHILATK